MIFGFIKPYIDSHTLGIFTIHDLVVESGYKSFVAPEYVCRALENPSNEIYFQKIKQWILTHKITHLGFSYRLDEKEGAFLFDQLYEKFQENKLFSPKETHAIKSIFFSGLPLACRIIKSKFNGTVPTFDGDEPIIDVLAKIGIPKSRIPKWIMYQNAYDADRWEFSKEIIEKETYKIQLPAKLKSSKHANTVEDRLSGMQKGETLLRAHVGPYDPNPDAGISLFKKWLETLSETRHLDIVSIGSSQLTQERFNQSWVGLKNGGGVPIRNEQDFIEIKSAARGLFLRAYSATNHIPAYAEMLENTINNAWHALSFWWFNKSDGRGPLSVKDCLKQHVESLGVIARYGKPFEPNISHHFSFRGADDLSSIIATFLAVKMAKKAGIKRIVLQTMLNTPKSTSGQNDIIKMRTLVKLVRTLEDRSFKIYLQPRAGLSYFSPDIEKAKIQLAAVSCLMVDIENMAPPIVHVVSFSEAVKLATPEIINESCQITRFSLKHYYKHGMNDIFSRTLQENIQYGVLSMCHDALKIISRMEQEIPNLLSAQGLYRAYKAGYFSVPQLWECRDELTYASNWNVKFFNGSFKVSDEKNMPMSIAKRLNIIQNNITLLRENNDF